MPKKVNMDGYTERRIIRRLTKGEAPAIIAQEGKVPISIVDKLEEMFVLDFDEY